MQPFIATTQLAMQRQAAGLRQMPPGGVGIVAPNVVNLRNFFPPSWFKSAAAQAASTDPDVQRAVELIKAIDAGGLPLNPARVNDIARKLGLEVSAHADMASTVARIRAAVDRIQP